MSRILLKYTLFVLGLSFNLKGITQKETITISFHSREEGFEYTVLLSNSSLVDKNYNHKIDTNIVLSSRDSFEILFPILYLNPENFTSATNIKQHKKFIEIHYQLQEITDSIVYLEFDKTTENLFNIINILNHVDPNPVNNKFQKNILSPFNLTIEYNIWLDDNFRCLNIVIDGRIFDSNLNIHQLEICSNNNDFFTPDWRFWDTNCRDFEWDTTAPQYWNLGFPCFLEKSNMEKLDSLLKSLEFSFLESTLKYKNQNYIMVDFYERGKFLYRKYYNFNQNDRNLFKLVYLIEQLEYVKDDYNSENWFFDYLGIEENYKNWKKENKKE